MAHVNGVKCVEIFKENISVSFDEAYVKVATEHHQIILNGLRVT